MHFSRPLGFTVLRSRLAPVVLASLSLAACFDSSNPDGGSSGSNAQATAIPTSTTGVTTGNAAPMIGGVPAASIPAGFPYVFKPTVSDPDGDALTFTIKGLPTWAEFNAQTGELRGTPTLADLGEAGGIVISASDGRAITAFGPFKVLVNRPANATNTGSRPPVISGSPATTVAAGTGYTLAVTASDPDGDRLTFGATNLPSWLGLNTANGMITGTPTTAQAGTYSNISVSVTDGTSTVSLPPFSITVTADGAVSGSTSVGTGTATLSWVKPTQNADGSALTDLAGFVLKYGNSPSTLTQRVAVNDPTMTRYTLQSLGKGTWYFTVVSYTVNGVESDVSQVVSKTIT